MKEAKIDERVYSKIRAAVQEEAMKKGVIAIVITTLAGCATPQ